MQQNWRADPLSSFTTPARLFGVASQISGRPIYPRLSTNVVWRSANSMEARASEPSILLKRSRAGIPCTARKDIRPAIWEKFGAFVAIAGAESAARLPAGPLRAWPEVQELLRGMLEETVAVAEATGIKLRDGYVEDTLGRVNVFTPTHMASMYVDLLEGKRLEVDGINGALVRMGKEHGVPTPLNFALYALLKPYADGPPTIPST